MKVTFLKNNKGASLITVIITLGFLAILASILLSAAVMNYQMKKLDARSKLDFYTVETVLDDVYNGIGRDMTTAMAEAYETALVKRDPTTGNAYEKEDDVYQYFALEFRAKFLELYDLENSQHVDINKQENRETLCKKLSEYIIVGDTDIASVDSIGKFEISSDNKKITMYDTVVTYKNNNMLTTSSITTDIVLRVPTVRFFTSHENIWDYAIIGNEGVVAQDTVTINGNIYSGVGTDITVNDSFVLDSANFIFNGNMLVSKGDIVLNDSTLNIKGLSNTTVTKANVWTDNIILADDSGDPADSNTLIANATIFTKDDLEMQSHNSVIELSGQYYGYSNKSYTDGPDAENHLTSSSISVNGKNNVVNLTGLELMIIAGRSYVDFKSEGYEGADGGVDAYATGEALSLKTNQFMYLVPTQFLKTTNPVNASQAQSPDESYYKFKQWFGYKYLDDTDPIIEYTVRYSGSAEFRYYYLNFKSADTYKNYVNDIVNGTSADAIQMRNTLNDRASNLLADSLNLDGCKIYSTFALMQYDGGVKPAEVSPSGMVGANIYAPVLGGRFEYICAVLDPLDEVPLEKNVNSYIANLPSRTNLPLGSYIDYNAFDTSNEIRNEYTDKKYKVTVVKGDSSFGSSFNDYEGIILVKGDAVLDAVNIKGIVMATGTITLRNGAKVTANRELAQTIIETELKVMAEEGTTKVDEAYKDYFISYLIDPKFNDTDNIYGNGVVGTDYSEFITFENWKKGDLN